MRRIVILLILQIIATGFCFGQLPHTFTQYTSEDGLSQNTIMSILQDDKGAVESWPEKDASCFVDAVYFTGRSLYLLRRRSRGRRL